MVEIVFTWDLLVQHWLKQMTNLGGDEWKETRTTFSPVFSPAKIKGTAVPIHTVPTNAPDFKIFLEYS
jgi:hypothetical protein